MVNNGYTGVIEANGPTFRRLTRGQLPSRMLSVTGPPALELRREGLGMGEDAGINAGATKCGKSYPSGYAGCWAGAGR